MSCREFIIIIIISGSPINNDAMVAALRSNEQQQQRIYYYYYYETASQSLALYERVQCTYIVRQAPPRSASCVRTNTCLPASSRRAAASGGGDVRRLRRRYGRAGRGGRQTNKQTDRQTDKQTDRQCSNYKGVDKYSTICVSRWRHPVAQYGHLRSLSISSQ